MSVRLCNLEAYLSCGTDTRGKTPDEIGGLTVEKDDDTGSVGSSADSIEKAAPCHEDSDESGIDRGDDTTKYYLTTASLDCGTLPCRMSLKHDFTTLLNFGSASAERSCSRSTLRHHSVLQHAPTANRHMAVSRSRY